MKKTLKKIKIVSPDGFTIELDKPYYNSPSEAWKSYMRWKEQFERQGYYSSLQYGRIPLSELDSYCLFSIID